ncbi:MAG TPA: hypothetical protein VMG09_03565 [Bacteroidota bacterium]|nr:hypothetical protein [Bacteroidota bacterium]
MSMARNSCTPALALALLVFAAAMIVSCKQEPAPVEKRVWTERELVAMQGMTRDEIRAKLGTPNGFYTRSAEGRWHYSNVLVDDEGNGPPKRMWIVIYFSKFGEQRATLVELHEHADQTVEN